MQKKIYFTFCLAACLIFASACNKNKPAELTTSAYEDTISDMEQITETLDETSDDSSEDTSEDSTKDEDASTKNSSSTENTKTDSSSSQTAASSTKATTTSSSNASKTTKATEEELITAEGDENFEEPTTATKESEKESWASSGTLSGFVDGDSVEIIMEDGSPKTFFVYDEKIAAQLEELLNSGEEKSIDFVSRPIAGQSNSQIIEIK